MPIVTMADGSQVNLPDNPSPELVERVKAANAKAQTKQLGGLALSAPTRGVAGVGNLYLRILNQLSSPLSAGELPATIGMLTTPPGKLAEMEGSKKARDDELLQQAETIKEFGTQPRGTGQEIASKVLESTAGAFAAPVPGMKAAEVALAGAGSGIGGEIGKRVVPPGFETAGEIGGALAGGLSLSTLPNIITRFKGSKEQLAKVIVDAMTREEQAAAGAGLQADRGNLVQTLLSQQADNPTLDAVASVLAEVNPRTRGILANQAGQASGQLSNYVERLPGQAFENNNAAANAIQQGSSEAIDRIKRAMTERFGNTVAGQTQAAIPTGQFLNFARRQIDQAIRANPGAAAELEQVYNRLANVGPAPATMQQLHDKITAISADIGTPGAFERTINAKNQAVLRSTLDRIFEPVAQRYAPTYNTARQDYRVAGEVALDPAEKSVLGRMAGAGAETDVEAPATKFLTLLKKGTNEDTPGMSEITYLGKNLNREDPNAVRGALKTYLSQTISDTVKFTPEGAVDPTSVRALVDKLFRTPSQRNGLRDALRIAGESTGSRNPDDLFLGLQRLMSSVMKVERQPGRAGQAVQNVMEAAGSNPGSTAAGALRFVKPDLALQRRYTERAFRRIGELFDSPEGLQEIQRLAQYAEGSPLIARAATSILTEQATKE